MRRILALAGLLLALGAGAIPATAHHLVIDVCPNLDGVQHHVPGRYEIVILSDGWACVLKS